MLPQTAGTGDTRIKKGLTQNNVGHGREGELTRV
jgi:hypothetical protein